MMQEVYDSDKVYAIARMLKWYWTDGLSLLQISKITGIPYTTLNKFFKQNGIKTRTTSKKIKIKGRIVRYDSRRLVILNELSLITDDERVKLKKAVAEDKIIFIEKKRKMITAQ